MQLSNFIKVVPTPIIREIQEETIHVKTSQVQKSFYALNDLNIEEQQLRKNGNTYYRQKLTVKIDDANAPKGLAHSMTMPLVVELYDTNGNKIIWGSLEIPVRSQRKMRGIGNEYTLTRDALSPLLPEL